MPPEKKPKPKKTRDEISDALKVYVPIALIISAGFAAAFYFVRPAPPDTLRMATGAEGGAYVAFAEQYKSALGREGVTLEIVATGGSLENLDRLRSADADRRVDIGFVQGGLGAPPEDHDLMTLGGMFVEPVWIFVRADTHPRRISELQDLKIAVGRPGSGTVPLAERLLDLNGVADGDNRVRIGGAEAVAALQAGEVDAAFFVTAGYGDAIRELAAAEGIHLLDLQRAETYARLDPALTSVTLPEGGLDLAANLPDRTLTLMAPVANLIAHQDLHPALAALLAQVATRVHAKPGLFTAPGAFPTATQTVYPVSEDARRFYEQGPSFLRRYLPFWAANLIQRLIVLAVPLVTLLIPLLRIAPPTYRWQVRRRIYRWYGDVRDIEAEADVAGDPESRADQLARLERIRREVSDVKVPLSYAEQLYHLRLHIDLVRSQLERGAVAPSETTN